MIPSRRRVFSLVALVAVTFAVGCLSRTNPKKQRYMLNVERTAPPDVGAAATGSGAPAPKRVGALRVGRIRVAPQFERQGFVYRKSDTKYERDFYNEFFEPPSVLFRQVTGYWMNESDLFSSVIGATDPDRADWLIEGRVDQLYADVRDRGAPKSVLRISYTLFDDRSSTLDAVFKKTYQVEIEAERASAAAFLAAWNQALARVLVELEADLAGNLAGVSKR